MFYGIVLRVWFGLLLIALSDASNYTNGSATSTFEIMTGYRLSHSFASASLESSIKCARACVREGNCTAASYDTTGKVCELDGGWNESNSTTVAAQGWELLTPVYTYWPNTSGNYSGPTASGCDSYPCLNNGSCNPIPGSLYDFTCSCTTPWQGFNCAEPQYWLCYNDTMVESECLTEPLRFFNHGNYVLTPGCSCQCCEIDYNFYSTDYNYYSTNTSTQYSTTTSPP